MRSSRCSQCALIQAETSTCKRCGAAIETPNPIGQHRPHVIEEATFQVSSAPYASPNPYQGDKLKSGLAIASMVLAIAAFPTMFFLVGLVLAPLAIILGIVAYRKVGKNPGVYGGKGFALAGIIVGSIVCFVFTPIIMAIAIPNLMAAKRAADEGAAFGVMEKIAVAQDKNATATAECGDLALLRSKNLIDDATAAGTAYGYKFTANGKSADPNGCEVRAIPIDGAKGTRSFYFSNKDGVVRAAQNGQPADHNSPELKRSKS